ncbi:hypothetical protein EU527_14995 [Candidatus Thorarchaeota archaeon]|nr:MAG: hypothetical protein EU527_14995 [Candidatus Thorarchaeota archaeon]
MSRCKHCGFLLDDKSVTNRDASINLCVSCDDAIANPKQINQIRTSFLEFWNKRLVKEKSETIKAE